MGGEGEGRRERVREREREREGWRKSRTARGVERLGREAFSTPDGRRLSPRKEEQRKRGAALSLSLSLSHSRLIWVRLHRAKLTCAQNVMVAPIME